jgi:long-chain acyl-CoA synthetase
MQGEAGPSLLRHWIARAATRDPDKAFIVSADDGRTLTYGQLRGLTGRIATYLRDQGVGTNDRIALLSNNSIEHLTTYFGVLAYGATICTVHVEMNRNQLDSILPMLKPRMVLCEDGLGLDDIFSAVSAPCRPLGAWDDRRGDSFFAAVNACEPGDDYADAGADDAAVVLFTSGTSARPKGVVLSFPRASVQHRADRRRLQPHRARPHLRFPLVQLVFGANLERGAAALRGATLILGRKFSRSRFFDHIRQYGATIATGNPTTIGILLNGDAAAAPELPRLRFMTSSSAPLLVDEWRRFEERFGIRVSQGYGCSEVGWIAAQPGEQRRIGTVGRPHDYHGCPLSAPKARCCRRAKRAQSSSAACAATPTARLPTTARSESIVRAA